MTAAFASTFERDLPLIREAQAGNVAARNELIMRWQGMLILHISRAVPNSDPYEHLGRAFLLCLRFVERFDPARGVAFSTYIGAHMPSLIRGSIWEEGGVCRRTPYRTLYRSSEKTKQLTCNASFPRSIERHGRNDSVMPFEAPQGPDVGDSLDAIDIIDEASHILTKQQAEAIRLRMKGLTLGQIGVVMGCSRQRCSQILLQATEILRQFGEQLSA